MIKMQLKKQHFLLRQTYDTQRTLQITMFATAEYRHVPLWRKKKSNPVCIVSLQNCIIIQSRQTAKHLNNNSTGTFNKM